MSDSGSSSGSDHSVTRRAMVGTGAAGVAALMAGCSGDGGSTPTDGGSTSTGDNSTSTGGGATATMNDNALEVLHGWTGGDGAAAWEELSSMFKEQYPDVKTNFRAIGGTGNVNLNSVVARRLANRNAPDAFAGWPGANAIQYGGRLGNITEVWEENGYVDSMLSSAAELCKINGEYRAMPVGSHRMNCLFYNKNVLSNAGVSPGDISSHSDLISAFDTVGSETDAIPMAVAMKAPWTTLQKWVEVFLGTEGYDAYMNWIEGKGDKAKVKSALQKTQEILSSYVNDDASTIGFTEANQKFMNDEAAFVHQGNWAYGQYRGNDDFNYGEDWDYIEWPGTEDMYTLHFDSFLITRDNNAPVKQEKWAKFVGQKDAQVAASIKGWVPVRTDADTSQLSDYLQETADALANKSKHPPTLAHGLAVTPTQLGECKSAIGNNFMGPFDAEATAQGLMDAVSN